MSAPVYGSDPTRYDFASALAAARTVEPKASEADALDRVFFARCAPRDDYRNVTGEVVPMSPATKAQLDRHRKAHLPAGVTFKEARRLHAAAVDEIERVYGLAENTTRDERADRARAFYDDGWPVSEIAREVGVSPKTVKTYLEVS
jgi:Helix-turn-helix domain of resolvase